ncbi:MAG: glycosyltransferase [Thermoanaerobaculia bacterium]
MSARADLHVHSGFSNRPSEWLLRRLGAPECFSEPREVYDKARAQGMSFVTITDHDSISGALEIAHLPGVFLSSEVTASFPEDGCRLHLLVFGVSEAQFVEIDRLRRNIYELRDHLYDEGIPCSVAHPLFAVSDDFTVAHFEKLLVLFKRFEAINGTREPRACTLANAVFALLTSETLGALADRHDIDPRDDQPWVKHLTAGSDDHSGLYIASAHVETPAAATVEEFLAHLAAGRTAPRGEHGSSLKLARNFCSIAYRYYRERLLGGASGRGELVGELISRLVDGRGGELGALDRLKVFAVQWLRPRGKTMGEVDRAVLGDLARLAGEDGVEGGRAVEERCFQIAADLGEKLAFASLHKASKHLRKGRLTEAIQSLSSVAPVAICTAPYAASFHTQHKDRRLLDAVATHFALSGEGEGEPARKVWFTDTFPEVNGVAVTVRESAALAARLGLDLEVLTSFVPDTGQLPPQVKNFAPIGDFRLPEYEHLRLSLPPFLHMIEHCERNGVGEVILSTPGPVGLVGLAAARLLRCRVTGIYHTDFPAYVQSLTGSPVIEAATWRYMRWFYGELDRLYVPSQVYVERLAENGFAADRLAVLPRGVDSERFHPGHRAPAFWSRHGLTGSFTLLYVGRVSKEKSLDVLLEAWSRLRAAGLPVDLAIVGDGPYRGELEARWRGDGVAFTGFLHGEALSRAYASADLFVFPSATDTFGNAVLEAHASGLAAVVSDRGGAQEIVRRSGGGLAVAADAPGTLAREILTLARDRGRLADLAVAGLQYAARASWTSLLDELWGGPVERLGRRHLPVMVPFPRGHSAVESRA